MAKNRRSNKISDHFSKRDFTCKCGTCNESFKLGLGLVGGLELLRDKAQNRINIIKGYSCSDAAEKEGTIKRNYHILGVAADITIDNLSLIETFKLAEGVPEFMGIGLDFSGNHVHVDIRKLPERHTWVVKNGKEFELTHQNRDDLLVE
ncbi:MAG: D-Ala-D-Ala carboxypeptidase family metallohydrolase [Candidatus Margulisiibacteriota bacterium]